MLKSRGIFQVVNPRFVFAYARARSQVSPWDMWVDKVGMELVFLPQRRSFPVSVVSTSL